MIFVDSDAFIALNSILDAHNQKSVLIYNSLINSNEELVTSWDVISEVSTKLSYYLSKSISTAFINFIYASNIKIEHVTRVSSEKVSITDCVNMSICRELGIKNIFSFDKHYLKNGFILLSSR